MIRDIDGPETGRRNILMDLLGEDMHDRMLDARNMFMRASS